MLFLFPTYNEEFASQIYEVICLGNISESESSLRSSIGKTHFSSWAFLSHVSPLLSHFISDASGHQMCADFPPPSSPSTPFGYPPIEFNFIQFWEYLPGGSVRSHRLRAQSHKPASSLLQMPISSGRFPGYPRFLSDWVTNWRFSQPPPQVWLIC